MVATQFERSRSGEINLFPDGFDKNVYSAEHDPVAALELEVLDRARVQLALHSGNTLGALVDVTHEVRVSSPEESSQTSTAA